VTKISYKQQMMKEETTYHIPVLLMPSVDAMNIRPDGTYVDVTFGGGGHSREILSRLEDGGRLLSFDQDEDAERNIVNNPHFTFVRSNFRYLHNFLRYHGIEKVDAILADLGVSSHHFDDSERGFSFRFDGALDMRMNKRAGLTAADIVNTYEEEKLADIFYLYGELKNSRKLASVIVKARATQRIATIGDFLEIVKPLFGREREKKELAKVHAHANDVFVIGRGIDYAVALEGSLKLKEISYIHSEAYAAGELKHGTISLIEEGTLVVAIATQDPLYEKLVSNVKEVKARGAYVVAIAKEGNTEIAEVADKVIYIPQINDKFTASLNVIPMQIFSYYVAIERGCDVDMPRNLAKSVTVE